MIGFTDPVWLLLLPALVAIALWAWLDGPFQLGPRRKTASLGIRILVILLVVFGLAGLNVGWSQGRQAVVFVADRSASNLANTSSMQNTVSAAAQSRPSDGLLGAVSVGYTATVEQPPSPLARFDGFQTTVDPTYTDLERGLELAASTLPDGYRRRLVVMSDGRQNVGDALGTVKLLHAQGIRVDVLPQPVTAGKDVRVDRVDAPPQIHTHERFSLTVTLHSDVSTSSRIDIYRDRSFIDTRQVRVPAGESDYAFAEGPLSGGVHTWQVRITPAVDAQPQNDSGSALTTVQGAPRVLVLALVASQAANVVHSLQSTGIGVDLRSPAQVEPTLTTLERYAAVVLVNVPVAAMDPALVAQFVPYVRDLGHGLVTIGGEDAYGLGAYDHTPLEQVLPVQMQLPRKRQVPSVAVVLVIESLEAPMPVNISKEAGKGVIKLLTAQDQVGVNDTPDDNSTGWVVPLQHPLDKATMYRLIARMRPGDPTTYTPFLDEAYLALRNSHARIKHIILLGDGDARSGSYESLIRTIRQGGVTVSTVVTNAMMRQDFQVMRDIARRGGGRYYRADDTSNVPRIFLREARTLNRSGVVNGRFFPERLSSNPIVRDVHTVPDLTGYVATGAKPTAEVVLASRKHDPVLATWQYGLGRTAAWTSDAAGQWTRDWLVAPGANRFWSNLVSWTFPSGTGSQLFVQASSSAGQGQVTASTPPSLGGNPSITARVVDPHLRATSIQLQPAAPGEYRASFATPVQGPYFVSVEARGAGHAQAAETGVDVPYPAEYQTSGTDLPFLQELARDGGGSVIRDAGEAWRDNLPAVYDRRSLADLLWLFAVLLLPVDVALRRLVLRHGEAVARGVPVRGGARPVPRLWPTGLHADWRQRLREGARTVAGPSGRTPGVQRSRGTAGVAVGPSPAPVAGTTASQLLAAKRRRQAEQSAAQ